MKSNSKAVIQNPIKSGILKNDTLKKDWTIYKVRKTNVEQLTNKQAGANFFQKSNCTKNLI